MMFGWFLAGLFVGAAGLLGVAYLDVRRAHGPLRVPLRVGRCAPERQRVSGASMVYGATEIYSHPDAAAHLRGATWAPGGRA